MRRSLVIVVTLALVAICAAVITVKSHSQNLGTALLKPHRAFSETDAPPAPDYAQPAAWSAWPGAGSPATKVPDGSADTDQEADAKVDVFFIQPTTYLFGGNWNAAYDQGRLTHRALETGVLPDQASAFNGCCRIYAPRYRQAILGAFFGETPDGDAALDLAYQDVKRAFDYIAHENHCRPFIIASHSQGSLHAMRLVQERVIGTPLAKQLVPADIEGKGLPICRTARQTGCAIDWNSVSPEGAAHRKNGLIWFDGRYQPVGQRHVVCVNPLTWEADGAAPASANLGALEPSRGAQTGKLVPGQVGGSCVDGLLQVSFPGRTPFDNLLTHGGVYHVFDYNLFYEEHPRNAEDPGPPLVGRQ